jgi:hypothetical protein
MAETKKKQISLSAIPMIIGFLSAFLPNSLAFAYNFSKDSGLDKTASNSGYETIGVAPERIIGRGIQFVISFLGILFLGFMIYAGILWMTASGDEKKVEKAREMIVESIIGLVIVSLAYALVYFITNFLGMNFFY